MEFKRGIEPIAARSGGRWQPSYPTAWKHATVKAPTILLTNNLGAGGLKLVTRYAQRMLIENGISEAVQFFHRDALSSLIGMKVDFDRQSTLLASA